MPTKSGFEEDFSMTGFIGGGNMAEALIKGIMKRKGGIIVSEPRSDRREFLAETYGVTAVASNTEVVEKANIVILAIKPQNMKAVLAEIAPAVSPKKTVVSIAAGITLSFLRSRLSTERLIRVMPNTAALTLEGMSALAFGPGLPEKAVADVVRIFSSVGKTVILPEDQMNAVTAVSGSGPAFVAFFVEAMISGAEKLGVARKNAETLAIQTLIGTAAMLKTGMPPENLRRMVTSPGGTTAAGVKVFEEKGLAALVFDSLDAAHKRAEELAVG
jgi:pyrroline-5-carboxylate reductase